MYLTIYNPAIFWLFKFYLVLKIFESHTDLWDDVFCVSIEEWADSRYIETGSNANVHTLPGITGKFITKFINSKFRFY